MAKGLEAMSLIERHYPSLLVIASQMVAATVNAAAKFCETGPEQIHPFMILHIRMLVTGLGCSLYLSQIGSSTAVAFFGAADVRGLIALRAIGGVFSATGFFCSLILSRFLSLGTIQWIDCVGAVGALAGVALVAQPEDILRIYDADSDVSVKTHGHLKGLAFGISGAIGGVEYLLTVGIAKDSSSAATLMIYTQIIWALVVDRAFFHITANGWALLGAATIIASLFLVTVAGGKRVGSIHHRLIDDQDEDAEMLDIHELHP
ncbi:hypothetical protein O1611_g2601 [Lasiodiplodia mahajangana]|uniref:Uncharacterized protein n=1 Tax=Lasiodiplodia mahajangana TaxID=1108764 RepID=A0ACC2JUF2_9PEZI|nr:hypothetical protein O1611_g2601 [Lasiodiplodia mahajangana]